MKIAHLSDLHYCPKHLKWVDKAMIQAVDQAIEDQYDCAVISGDLFDRAMPAHEPAVAALFLQVMRLANHMPVALLSGTLTHDPAGCLEMFKHVPTRHQILVIDELGAWVLYRGQWVPYGDGVYGEAELLLCGLPSLNKADKGIMDTGPAAYVKGVMAEFAPMAAQARAAGVPSVLTTHGEILGSVTESNHAMLSPDHEFTEEILFSAGCDAVMIGHIHKHQVFVSDDQKQVIVYPGSLARLTFGDHNSKGWVSWLFGDNQPVIKFMPVPCRDLIEIDYDSPPDMAELKEVSGTAGADDSVRIRWVIDQEYSGTVDQKAIKEIFAHVETLKLEQSILPIQSVRSEEMLKASSLEDKIKVWLDSTGDSEVFEGLSRRLAELQQRGLDVVLREI